MKPELPDGAICFLDANIFYYHFVQSGEIFDRCTDLLLRAQNARITAFSSAHVIAEAIHKIMIAEAAARFSLGRAGLVSWLQRNPQRVTELGEFSAAAQEIAAMTITTVALDAGLLVEASNISRTTGLLTNDAAVLAVMR